MSLFIITHGKAVQQYRVVPPYRRFVSVCSTPPSQQVALTYSGAERSGLVAFFLLLNFIESSPFKSTKTAFVFWIVRLLMSLKF